MKSHDKIIDLLEDKVRDADITGREEEYGPQFSLIGELDYYIYDKKSKNLWLFEIKSSYSKDLLNKAKSQLRRANRCFVKEYFPFRVNNVFNYFVTNTKKGLHIEYLGGVNYGRKNM